MARRVNPNAVKKGSVLLAEPFMMDPHFKRAVILLTEHSSTEGSVGFILNKPIKVKINELVGDFPEIDAPVYFGGPVAKETLHYIHDVGEILDGSVKISQGIYWGGDFEKLKFLINSKLVQPHNIKFFLGYSGWSADQLMDEMTYGSWVLAHMDVNYAFKTKHYQMWSQVMKHKGGNYTVIGEMPETSFLN